MVSTAASEQDEPDAAWTSAGQGQDYHRQLTTLEGWREFTTAVTEPPELLPQQQWNAWRHCTRRLRRVPA